MTTPAPPLKPGAQLASTVCTTRVVVVKASAKRQPVIECGGSPMVAVALRADLYVRDEQVRRLVLRATEANGAEIRLWGDAWPDDFDDHAGHVCHEPSIAARAFKAQALHAVGVRAVEADAAAAPGHEMFRQGEIRRPVLAVAR